jgi:hypothetical protein
LVVRVLAVVPVAMAVSIVVPMIASMMVSMMGRVRRFMALATPMALKQSLP